MRGKLERANLRTPRLMSMYLLLYQNTKELASFTKKEKWGNVMHRGGLRILGSGLGGGLRLHLTSTGHSEIRSEILSISRPDSYQNPLLCDEWVGYGHKTSQNPGAITIFWAFL